MVLPNPLLANNAATTRSKRKPRGSKEDISATPLLTPLSPSRRISSSLVAVGTSCAAEMRAAAAGVEIGEKQNRQANKNVRASDLRLRCRANVAVRVVQADLTTPRRASARQTPLQYS